MFPFFDNPQLSNSGSVTGIALQALTGANRFHEPMQVKDLTVELIVS
jgi:hypothetical protein